MNYFPNRFSCSVIDKNRMVFCSDKASVIVSLQKNGMAKFHLSSQFIGQCVWNGSVLKNPPTLDSTDPLFIEFVQHYLRQEMPYYRQ